LNGLFGREAGKEDGYKYSRALAEAGFIWTEEKLEQWLAKPNAFLPGNKMAFAGIREDQDRKDLIAYLRRATVASNEE
jgi:cytochrome c